MSGFMLNNRYLREVLTFFFHLKKTTAEAHRELHKVYGAAALSETTCLDGSVPSRTVISMLTTARVKKGPKPSKTVNWRHCSMPNTTRAFVRIRSYPPSYFQATTCGGNDSKARNLDSL
ncbi:hypothetical protein Trydic_g3913 [Trypoxylus dichotomus]